MVACMTSVVVVHCLRRYGHCLLGNMFSECRGGRGGRERGREGGCKSIGCRWMLWAKKEKSQMNHA